MGAVVFFCANAVSPNQITKGSISYRRAGCWFVLRTVNSRNAFFFLRRTDERKADWEIAWSHRRWWNRGNPGRDVVTLALYTLCSKATLKRPNVCWRNIYMLLHFRVVFTVCDFDRCGQNVAFVSVNVNYVTDMNAHRSGCCSFLVRASKSFEMMMCSAGIWGERVVCLYLLCQPLKESYPPGSEMVSSLCHLSDCCVVCPLAFFFFFFSSKSSPLCWLFLRVSSQFLK